MNHKEIIINGQNIAYYESRGKGKQVLFIHGNSMSGRCFEKQLSSSIGEQHRLVALDLPGHGMSAPAQDPHALYSLPGYASTVSSFVKQLGIDDALLVGWSLGGHIALEASQNLPNSTGIMICGTPPIGKPIAEDAFYPNPLFPLSFKCELNDAEINAVTSGFFKPGTQIPALFTEDMKRADGRTREVLGQSVAEGNYADEVTIVANLEKPLAIIQGDCESIANPSYFESLAIPSLWRGAIQLVPDAGHTPHWEQPEIFNSLLTQFIAELNVI
jgi:pimeloyl-ACP methyl ester carboxylesterase